MRIYCIKAPWILRGILRRCTRSGRHARHSGHHHRHPRHRHRGRR